MPRAMVPIQQNGSVRTGSNRVNLDAAGYGLRQVRRQSNESISHFFICSYPNISLTTCASSTPVGRCDRPRNLNVNLSWSIPSWCRIVALRSRM